MSALQGDGSQLWESCAATPRGEALELVMSKPPSTMGARRSQVGRIDLSRSRAGT